MAGSETGAITSSQVRRKKKEVDVEMPEEIKELAEKEKEVVPEADKILASSNDEKYLVKMERKNASWETPSEVIFTPQHPFQLVNETELDELLDQGGFRRADPRELVNFYKQ